MTDYGHEPESLEGHILVARVSLQDPNFFRTVVLIIKHNEEGALGLILNRASRTQVCDIWEKLSNSPCLTEEPLRLGGPVQGPLMALHSCPTSDDEEVIPGVRFCTEQEHLEKVVGQNDYRALYFVGYAGWGEGQLERELQEGSWETLPATLDHVFFADGDLWEEVIKHISGTRMLDMLNIKHIPDDPRLN